MTAAATPAAAAITGATSAAQPPTMVAGATATFPLHAPTMTAHAAHRTSEASFLAARLGVAHLVHDCRTPDDAAMLLQDRRLLTRSMEFSHHALSNGLLMTRREAGTFAAGVDNEEAAHVALLGAGHRQLQQGLWAQLPGAPAALTHRHATRPNGRDDGAPRPMAGDVGLITRAPEPPIESGSADETRKRKARERKAKSHLAPGVYDRKKPNQREQCKRQRDGGGGAGSGGSGGRGSDGRGSGSGGGEGIGGQKQPQQAAAEQREWDWPWGRSSRAQIFERKRNIFIILFALHIATFPNHSFDICIVTSRPEIQLQAYISSGSCLAAMTCWKRMIAPRIAQFIQPPRLLGSKNHRRTV